jgi:hypothetical protein
MKNAHKNLLALSITTIFLLLAMGSFDDSIPEAQETSKNSEKIISDNNHIDNNIIMKFIYGKWKLDSLVMIPNEYMKKNPDGLSGIKHNKDGTIVNIYQPSYRNSGDIVTIKEFKKEGIHISTIINDYTIKNQPGGKSVSKNKFAIENGSIISILEWGKNKQNETKIIFDIKKINENILVYKLEAEQMTFYFSKVK